jgi:hypothetical protein
MDRTPKLSSAMGITLICLGTLAQHAAPLSYIFMLEKHLMLFGGR